MALFHVKQFDSDVTVVGGGHAGVEAAHAAARLGASVILVTHDLQKIGEMSCNPAIGGIGKAHLVREVDALDGVMARAADASGIQFRLLNSARGPAVQGPRVQCDRAIYKSEVQRAVKSCPNIRLVAATVDDLKVSGSQINGVILEGGEAIRSRSVVLTTGTFLNGVMHTGAEQSFGGRAGDASSTKLGRRLDLLGLPVARLKTGTPPRLDGRTIDWAKLQKQRGDQTPTMLSFLSIAPRLRQVDCAITHTNKAAHHIINENLQYSPMFSGRITGAAPRYCPSIEDKVVRFAEKMQHQIFLEPEGLNNVSVYPNGISTSLPADVQEAFVRLISGLESAVFLRHGYAIEYDYIDPSALNASLAVASLEGLFLAGQINGTTGYEEAAAQGIIAGINAALSAFERCPFVPTREKSYIGVMIDDLTTRGVTEPYRMFTSRAEFRLSLRIDNADQRLTPLGIDIGCIGSQRCEAFERKMLLLENARRTVESGHCSLTTVSGSSATSCCELFGPAVAQQLQIEAHYRCYVERQGREAARLEADRGVLLPESLDFSTMPGLSSELREKLTRFCPETLAQAGRIEGMTPAALALLHGVARRAGRSKA